MTRSYDAAVVGAGIVGLAHAYHLAKQGMHVAVFERGAHAMGASVRNFGMLWPIGQAPGAPHDTALRSREIWLEILRASGIWHEQQGSLHLAYREDEADVLAEFAAAAPGLGYTAELLSPVRVMDIAPAVNPDGLRAGLFSVREVDGTTAVFQALRAAGVKVSLDTGFNRNSADAIIERLGWQRAGLLDATVTSDEVKAGRPHPDMIYRLMELTGISEVKRVCKVGDTPADLHEGASAHCR